MNAKHFFTTACALCATALFVSCGAKSVSADKGIKKVATVAESFGDGEKVSTVIITYAKNIDEISVLAESYAVECVENGATVLRTVESAEVNGKTVTLHLKYVNKWDATNGQMPKREQPKSEEGESVQANNGPRFDDDGIPVDVTATVTQIADIKAADGTVYTASETAIRSTESTELVLQDFEKQYFTDDETGITLPYFVYLPADYKQTERYPLAFFVPDASADTSIETATLTQGNGATIWATSEEQAKHPAIVVAVQYPYAAIKEFGALTDDTYTWTTGLTARKSVIPTNTYCRFRRNSLSEAPRLADVAKIRSAKHRDLPC